MHMMPRAGTTGGRGAAQRVAPKLGETHPPLAAPIGSGDEGRIMQRRVAPACHQRARSAGRRRRVLEGFAVQEGARRPPPPSYPPSRMARTGLTSLLYLLTCLDPRQLALVTRCEAGHVIDTVDVMSVAAQHDASSSRAPHPASLPRFYSATTGRLGVLGEATDDQVHELSSARREARSAAGCMGARYSVIVAAEQGPWDTRPCQKAWVHPSLASGKESRVERVAMRKGTAGAGQVNPGVLLYPSTIPVGLMIINPKTVVAPAFFSWCAHATRNLLTTT